MTPGKIGVFDSGYGGLTILTALRRQLPQYDYLYLGDNARAPYGNRSFDVVYRFTLQAVEELFRRGCNLVILACNTASAKALRSIQQNDLPRIASGRRVLGVIRPTAEAIDKLTLTRHIGVLATKGTIDSQSYNLEMAKLNPDVKVNGHACPMWVHLVENNEALNPGADYFVKKDLDILLTQDPEIDTVILGCTHYPILLPKISRYVPNNIKVIAQGEIVAKSLAEYLTRHPEIRKACTTNGNVEFLTTENPEVFDRLASVFLNCEIHSEGIRLPRAIKAESPEINKA